MQATTTDVPWGLMKPSDLDESAQELASWAAVLFTPDQALKVAKHESGRADRHPDQVGSALYTCRRLLASRNEANNPELVEIYDDLVDRLLAGSGEQS